MKAEIFHFSELNKIMIDYLFNLWYNEINKGVLYKPGHEQSLVHWFGQMQGIRPQ